MTDIQYRVVESHNGASVTAKINGEMFQADSLNPKFKEILRGLRKMDDSVVDLFNAENAMNDAFSELTDLVRVENGVVEVDGVPAPAALNRIIMDLYHEGSTDYKPFVYFLERLSSNPSFRSREQLYSFVERYGITLTKDGKMVLYKGVQWRESMGCFTSLHSGTAWVNGQKVEGYIPARVGDVVAMPRKDISDDPNVGCHVGLHCGAWEYASSFGDGNTITVLVDPQHVVCVPADFSFQKIRVEEYTIQGSQTAEHEYVSWERDEDEDEDDDYEYDLDDESTESTDPYFGFSF